MILSIWHLVAAVGAAVIVAHYFTAVRALREVRAAVREVQTVMAREHHEKYMDSAAFYWRKNRSDAIQWVMDAAHPAARQALIDELGEAGYRTYLGSVYDRSKKKE